MAIRTAETEHHWNYFLALEEDLARLARYVDFSEQNFATFSTEMTILLIASASEVDVVMKLRCGQIGHLAGNMREYRAALAETEPRLRDMEAAIPRFGLTLRPWANWREDVPPDWWSDHNAVKHNRSKDFEKANLKNVVNAMGGLFLLLLAYFGEDAGRSRLVPAPILFNPPSEYARKGHALDGETGLFFDRE